MMKLKTNDATKDNVWLGQKKIIQLSVCPINGMLVTITHNVRAYCEVVAALQYRSNNW